MDKYSLKLHITLMHSHAFFAKKACNELVFSMVVGCDRVFIWAGVRVCEDNIAHICSV